MNNPALLCSSDYMSNKLGIIDFSKWFDTAPIGIDLSKWVDTAPKLFIKFCESKLVKATAVHNTPELNIPGLAELQASQHSIDLGWSNVFLIQLMDTRGPIERAVEQIKNGADVEKKDQWGDTPLMSTFQYNDLKLVEYLIEKCGADVNKTSTKGKTVLMTAVHYNDIEAVKYLIKQCGADVEKQDEDGMTALIHAAYYNKLQVVEYLIKQCGADAEKQDKDGKTALMHAAKEGYLDMARCLVECGANPEESKVVLERAFGQEVFAELESLFLGETIVKEIFDEAFETIVQEEAIAFVDMDSPLAGVYVDVSNGLGQL
jgi:ankyrin repeat protein